MKIEITNFNSAILLYSLQLRLRLLQVEVYEDEESRFYFSPFKVLFSLPYFTSFICNVLPVPVSGHCLKWEGTIICIYLVLKLNFELHFWGKYAPKHFI